MGGKYSISNFDALIWSQIWPTGTPSRWLPGPVNTPPVAFECFLAFQPGMSQAHFVFSCLSPSHCKVLNILFLSLYVYLSHDEYRELYLNSASEAKSPAFILQTLSTGLYYKGQGDLCREVIPHLKKLGI